MTGKRFGKLRQRSIVLCKTLRTSKSVLFLCGREIIIPFLLYGPCRINWTHAIQAPMATVKQQAVKALANIKEFMNVVCAHGGPPPPFDGTKQLKF